MASKIHAEDSNILTFCNDRKAIKLILSYFFGLLPFVKIDEVALQLPLYTEDFKKWKLSTAENKLKVHIAFQGLKILNFVIQPMIWHLKKRGIMTFYWVCNT
jgi:hypothetical protein